jgi:amino acid transporter
MQKNGTLPAAVGRLDARHGVPRVAMWVNLAASFVFLFFFRGWSTLAAVLSVALVISYVAGPVASVVLRRTAPERPRPLRVRGLGLFAALGFVCCTELLYWATWPLTAEVIVLMAVAMPVYLYYQAKAGWRDFARPLRGAAWLIAYLPTVAALSYVGSRAFGGRDWIPFGWDLLAVAVVGLGFHFWALRCGWRTPDLDDAAAP